MIEDFDDTNFEEEEEEEVGVWHDCPNCGHPFDEIDFEYQICHFCKHDASQERFKLETK